MQSRTARSLRTTLAAVLLAVGAVAVTASPAAAETDAERAARELAALISELYGPGKRIICYSAHVENIGWQEPVCNGQTAGTTGRNLQMEGLIIATSPAVGQVCGIAHIQNHGWRGDCGSVITIGITGQHLQMEAVSIAVANPVVVYRAHVSNYGWRPTARNGEVSGFEGRNLQMEAIEINV